MTQWSLCVYSLPCVIYMTLVNVSVCFPRLDKGGKGPGREEPGIGGLCHGGMLTAILWQLQNEYFIRGEKSTGMWSTVLRNDRRRDLSGKQSMRMQLYRALQTRKNVQL